MIFPPFAYNTLVCCLVLFLRAVSCGVAYCCAEPTSCNLLAVLCSMSVRVALEALRKTAVPMKELAVVELAVIKYPLIYKPIGLLWASYSNVERGSTLCHLNCLHCPAYSYNPDLVLKSWVLCIYFVYSHALVRRVYCSYSHAVC